MAMAADRGAWGSRLGFILRLLESHLQDIQKNPYIFEMVLSTIEAKLEAARVRFEGPVPVLVRDHDEPVGIGRQVAAHPERADRRAQREGDDHATEEDEISAGAAHRSRFPSRSR